MTTLQLETAEGGVVDAKGTDTGALLVSVEGGSTGNAAGSLTYLTEYYAPSSTPSSVSTTTDAQSVTLHLTSDSTSNVTLTGSVAGSQAISVLPGMTLNFGNGVDVVDLMQLTIPAGAKLYIVSGFRQVA